MWIKYEYSQIRMLKKSESSDGYDDAPGMNKRVVFFSFYAVITCQLLDGLQDIVKKALQ